MKSTNPLVWALVAALALFLAGCGGGSSNTGTGDMPDPPTPAEQAQAEYDKAKAAEMAAMTARTTAKAQLDAAKLANAYDLYTTGGDSSVVHTNAKVITDAKAAVEKALADAKAEKMKIDEALKALNGVAAGTPGLAAQKEVLDQQSKDVAAQIKLIEGYLRTVTGYAARVDTEAKIKALADETPAGAARATDNTSPPAGTTRVSLNNTAQAVLEMLQPRSTSINLAKHEARWIRRATNIDDLIGKIPTKRVSPDYSNDLTATDTGRSKPHIKYDLRGLPEDAMTWEQIAAKDGMLVKKAFGTGNMDVDVLPLAGMPLSVLTNASGSGTARTALPAFTGGKAAETQYYKGIAGTLHCQGSCTVDEGKLTGMLFFQKAGEEVPDSTLYYQMKPLNDHYTPYVAYARYGYWLYQKSADVEIRLFAHAPANGGDVGETAGLAKTATYKGEAFGLSVVKTYTAGTPTGQKSGQFTADVTLNATFKVGAANPKMGGKVDNFMGHGVGSDWSVKLTEKDSRYDDIIDIVDGVAQGSASAGGDTPQAGVWVAGAYNQGKTGRPVGAIGAFNAHFTNGHAAGTFATRIETE